MVNRKVVIDKLVEFANTKLTELTANNPLFMIVVRPIAARVINNNISKLDSLLKLIQDKDGNVDIEGIIGEMEDNLLVAATNSYPDILGGIKIENGTIKINIPGMDKAIMFNADDIDSFKNNLINS